MASFFSVRLNALPSSGIPGDVYYTTDSRQLSRSYPWWVTYLAFRLVDREFTGWFCWPHRSARLDRCARTKRWLGNSAIVSIIVGCVRSDYAIIAADSRCGGPRYPWREKKEDQGIDEYKDTCQKLRPFGNLVAGFTGVDWPGAIERAVASADSPAHILDAWYAETVYRAQFHYGKEPNAGMFYDMVIVGVVDGKIWSDSMSVFWRPEGTRDLPGYVKRAPLKGFFATGLTFQFSKLLPELNAAEPSQANDLKGVARAMHQTCSVIEATGGPITFHTFPDPLFSVPL